MFPIAVLLSLLAPANGVAAPDPNSACKCRCIEPNPEDCECRYWTIEFRCLFSEFIRDF